MALKLSAERGRHTEAPVAADFGSLWKVNTPPSSTVHVWLQFFLKQQDEGRDEGGRRSKVSPPTPHPTHTSKLTLLFSHFHTLWSC